MSRNRDQRDHHAGERYLGGEQGQMGTRLCDAPHADRAQSAIDRHRQKRRQTDHVLDRAIALGVERTGEKSERDNRDHFGRQLTARENDEIAEEFWRFTGDQAVQAHGRGQVWSSITCAQSDGTPADAVIVWRSGVCVPVSGVLTLLLLASTGVVARTQSRQTPASVESRRSRDRPT